MSPPGTHPSVASVFEADMYTLTPIAFYRLKVGTNVIEYREMSDGSISYWNMLMTERDFQILQVDV